MLRRRLVGKAGSSNSFEGISPSEAPALSVVFYNTKTGGLAIAPKVDTEMFPPEYYHPIGIVVIPANHGMLVDSSGNLQCGVMSLTCMSQNLPEVGAGGGQEIAWGYNGQTTGNTIYQGIVQAERANAVTANGIVKSGSIPCQRSSGSNAYHSGMPYCLSPYLDSTLNTGDFNPNYFAFINSVTHDFDGVNNTKILTDLSTAYDWRNGAIVNTANTRNHFPAACCCARFHTEGTKAFKDCSAEEIANGRGFWYLPSGGEIGYLAPRVKDIIDILYALERWYDADIINYDVLNTEYYLWTSSTYDAQSAWRYNLDGHIDTSYKNYYLFAIAFMRL